MLVEVYNFIFPIHPNVGEFQHKNSRCFVFLEFLQKCSLKLVPAGYRTLRQGKVPGGCFSFKGIWKEPTKYILYLYTHQAIREKKILNVIFCGFFQIRVESRQLLFGMLWETMLSAWNGQYISKESWP